MAIVRVRYFAAAADAASREEEELDLGSISTLGELRTLLTTRYGEPMIRVLENGSFLVGGRVRRDPAYPITESVVDILPPFAGG